MAYLVGFYPAQSKRSLFRFLVGFLVRAHAWTADSVPGRGAYEVTN